MVAGTCSLLLRMTLLPPLEFSAAGSPDSIELSVRSTFRSSAGRSIAACGVGSDMTVLPSWFLWLAIFRADSAAVDLSTCLFENVQEVLFCSHR